MCWIENSLLSKMNKGVSVAGCLGYDVLAKEWTVGERVIWFQLLVV